jgi:hypothetical protein
MATSIDTAPDDDSEHETIVRSTPVNPKEKPPMVTTSDSVPNPSDDMAMPEAAAAPPPTSEQAPTTPACPEPPDPFDPTALRLDADYSEGLGIRKVITTVPNRKPNKSEWFQVRLGDEWRLQTAVLELEKGVERSTYLVAPPPMA